MVVREQLQGSRRAEKAQGERVHQIRDAEDIPAHRGAKLQLIAATHSPLVLASAEPFFDETKDTWFDLDLDRPSGVVELRHRAFVRHGDVSNWLTSEAFDLKEARSREAEDAIERARALLRSKRPALAQARTIDDQLRKAGLPDIDPFWVRWSAFVDKLAGQS